MNEIHYEIEILGKPLTHKWYNKNVAYHVSVYFRSICEWNNVSLIEVDGDTRIIIPVKQEEY